jgi:hypothetical protein
MNDIAPTSTYRACLFVDENGGTQSEERGTACDAYSEIETALLQYVARFDFEQEVRPFQLRYRQFNLYVCDICGWDDELAKQKFMSDLGHLVRGRSSRVFLFWTGETWEEFCRVNPDLRGYDTCINACQPLWAELVSAELEKH